MNLVDFILNIIGLLLWINWRTAWAMRRRSAGISLSGAIKRTDPQPGSEITSIASLLTMLIVRAIFYWNLGPALEWTATINLVPVSLPLRSDVFPLMLIFSFASFGLTLAVYYMWLLLLSVLNRNARSDDIIQRFIRLQLGNLDRLGTRMKLVLPIVLAGVAWMAAVPILKHFGIIPAPVSKVHIIEQSLVMALSAVLGWRGILIFIIVAYIINTYVFLGEHPIWAYVDNTTNNLLGPLKRFRGRFFDLGSTVLLLAIFLVSYVLSSAFVMLFAKLPL